MYEGKYASDVYEDKCASVKVRRGREGEIESREDIYIYI